MDVNDNIGKLMQSQEPFVVPPDLEKLVLAGVEQRKRRKSTISLLRVSLVYTALISLYLFIIIAFSQFLPTSQLLIDLKMGILTTLAVYTVYNAVSVGGDFIDSKLNISS